MDLISDNGRTALKLKSGKVVEYFNYFTLNMFIEYKKLKDLDLISIDKFRELIKAAEVIEDFKVSE